MKYYCRYHPMSPAIWFCDACNTHYDKLCMPDGDDKSQEAQCPQCRQSMQYLDRKNVTEPFWTQKTQFIRILYQADALLALCLMTLLSGLLFFNPLVTSLCTVALFFLTTNYAIAIARHVEDGQEQPLKIADMFVFKHFTHNSIIIAILFVSTLLPVATWIFVSGTLAVVLGIVLISLTPALSLMMLYTPPNFARRKFVRPSWLKIIRRMESSYFSLVAYFALSYLLIITIYDFTLLYTSAKVAISATTFAACLAIWFNFAVLGYILRRYEGFNATDSRTRTAKETHKKGSLNLIRFEADLDIAIKTGNFDEAVHMLETVLQKQSRSDLRRQQLYKLLIEKNDLTKLEQYAESFIDLLLARGQTLQAYELVSKIREANPAFQFFNIELMAELAEVFNEMKEFELVLWLADSTHLRFDPSTQLANLQLRAAKVLLAKYGNKKEALAYLSQIDKFHHEEEIGGAARRLIQHIKGN